MSRKGVAVDMSTDHKPEDDLELARIEKAGGAVVDGRVQVRHFFPVVGTAVGVCLTIVLVE